jgi:FixJ family two-component response regulator
MLVTDSAGNVRHGSEKARRLLLLATTSQINPASLKAAVNDRPMLGKSNQEIAEGLGVSGNTVAYHIKQLFLKLNVHDRAGAVERITSGSPACEVKATSKAFHHGGHGGHGGLLKKLLLCEWIEVLFK